METLVQDVRFTLRHMMKHAGLSTVIVLSLALGIGANTAIFSLIRGVILRGIPVQDPERLVLLHWGADTWPAGLVQSGSGGPRGTRWRSTSRSLPFPFYREIARDRSLFASVIAFAPLGISRQNVTLAAGGLGERVDGEMVSGSFFQGLGVTAAAGRVMSEADEQADARVAVLSHAYWVRRFAADPNVVGTTITINSLPFAVVGVARAGFFGVQPGRRPDVWIPFVDAPQVSPWGYRPAGGRPSLLTVRDYWWVQVMARLKEGADARQAAAAADSRFQRFVHDALPGLDRERPPHLGFEPGAGGLDMVRGAYQRPLSVLMGMVGIVLLIACANVAVLLLSGSTARRREFALRLSLGAARPRLVRQLLTESLIMATAGGLLGLLFAGWTSRGLLHLLPASQRPVLDNPVDAGVLAFAAAVSAATALLFGIVPALVGTRVDLLAALKQSASGTVASDHPAHRIWSSTLVVVQIAMSLMLLVGAALFVRTINHLHAQPLGVEHDRLLVLGMDASQNGYSGDRLAAIYSEVLGRLQAVPGVQSATAARHRLFSGWVSSGPIHVPGDQPKEGGMNLFANGVGPEFARTTGLTLLAGRDVQWEDIEGRRRVAVVNEAMAQYFYGGSSAVGRRFGFGATPDGAGEYEIVGVVSNAKYASVDGAFPRTAYLPYSASRAALGELHMIVRTTGDPLTVAAAVREAVRRVDPSISVVNLDSMANQIDDSLWRERLFARLTSAFGLLALTLACIGLYGTIAYGVGRRRAEIAVRVALGAARSQILWMVLRRALLLAAAGVALGIPLSLWSGRFVATQLVGVTPRDPAAFAAGAAILIAVAGLAGYIPARRATLIEPAAALNQE